MTKEKNKEFNLEHHIVNLLRNEPFFAALSRRINKSKSYAIPTAGVRVNPDTAQFEMLYNPDFFNKLTHLERLDVLKHEFYHLIFEHVTSRKPEDINPRVWNFATDLAINSHLENLPENCVRPGYAPFEDFDSGLSSEKYLKLLKKMQEENKEDQEGDKGDKGDKGEEGESGQGSQSGDGLPDDGQFDSHDEWDTPPDADGQQANDIAAERLKEYIRKAAEEAQKGSGWGSVPGSVQRDIAARLQTRVDWRNVLRYFIKTSLRSDRTSTVKRINKRYRYIHPGKKVNRHAKIAISIDQSGSVSDSMLEAFFSELNKLADLATFTVIPFDTRVDPDLVYEWKRGEKSKAKRVMCGGTDFDAPTKYVNKKGFDGHIILTDMYAPKPIASKCQRMWMTTKHHLQSQFFQTSERVLAIDA